ncbi:MAG: hypothetical protein KQH67_01485 [Bacteroidetes bacterium]|nr:hypothetical protein [Bacteroidota bacterium]
MKNRLISILLVFYAVIATLTILFFDGTGDAGDSIHHYLFARYAPIHPELYFNHWAKPVYVLLASPFSQFGFVGVKIFNVIVSGLTIYFTYLISQKLQLRNAIISAVILISIPLFFVLTFSGLTEPLFALFISIGLYALLQNKYITAAVIISFLPFIRSEGLIILGIFALYFLIQKKWKFIPWLLFGHIVYSVAGFFVYHDFFWIFNKIPYAHLSSTYGSGELFHFVEELIYVLGVPIYVLFWLGIISIVWKTIKKKVSYEIFILVFLGFLAFLVAHSLFWYLGIFNSMGLLRVFIGVVPLMAIISLMGLNLITEEIFKNNKIAKRVIQGLFIVYVLIFPFTSNPAAINWKKDLNLSADQQSALRVADFIDQHKNADQRFIFAHPYLSEVLHLDHFDVNQRLELTNDIINQTKKGDIIIWENWFAVVEHDVKKESLDGNSEFVNIYNSNITDDGREIIYAVYQRK